MLRIKKGAVPSYRLEMIKVRKAVVRAFSKLDTDITVWLTSGMDGEHYEGSLHYSGYAEDFDGDRELTTEEWQFIRRELMKDLNDKRYQVIVKNHVHVEFDPPEFKTYK